MPAPPHSHLPEIWQPPPPRQIPVLRHRLASVLDTPGYLRLTVAALEAGQGTLVPTGSGPVRAAQHLVAEERLRLTRARLYCATPQMTRLAVAAGSTLPDRRPASSVLPSPYGLMVFGEPIASYRLDDHEHTVHISAVSWGRFDMSAPHWDHIRYAMLGPEPATADAHPWLWVTFWSQGPTRREFEHVRPHLGGIDPGLLRALSAPLRWDNENLCGLDLPDDVTLDEPPGDLKWLDTVMAAWRLMADSPRTIEVTREERPRSTVKRDARAGYDPEPVRVIRLRRPSAAPEHATATLGPADARGRRHLTERHDVAGHWWMRASPNPVWVEEYERGPKDAPKRARRETVAVWDR